MNQPTDSSEEPVANATGKDLLPKPFANHRESKLRLKTELVPWNQWPDLEGTEAQMPRLNAHHPAWIRAIAQGLSHTPLILVHKTPAGRINGVLPLMLVKSLLFGRFLTSLPYVNTGGVWCEEATAAAALIDHGCALADQHNVRFLELRHEQPVPHAQLNAERSDKLHMRLELPATDEEFEQSMKSKLRSQIKKSNQHGLVARWGRHDLLNDFYRVFAVNMRDLGTPVFSKRLFREILNEFSADAELCVLYLASRPIAGGLLVHSQGITEVPSASCLRQFNYTNANMWMYRQLLRRAIERGSRLFDFGRSSEGSGTFKFKAQWGAVPSPAVWQYYVRRGTAEEMRPDSSGNQRLIQIWKKLPVPLTKLIGPAIVRGIP